MNPAWTKIESADELGAWLDEHASTPDLVEEFTTAWDAIRKEFAALKLSDFDLFLSVYEDSTPLGYGNCIYFEHNGRKLGLFLELDKNGKVVKLLRLDTAAGTKTTIVDVH